MYIIFTCDNKTVTLNKDQNIKLTLSQLYQRKYCFLYLINIEIKKITITSLFIYFIFTSQQKKSNAAIFFIIKFLTLIK